MSSLIQAKDLEVHRQGKYILQNVSLSVGKKDFITIIGPNGAGKSILLECLMGTFMPDKGEIDKKNNLSIGYIPQNFNPDNSMPISVKRFLMLRKNFTPKELKSVSDQFCRIPLKSANFDTQNVFLRANFVWTYKKCLNVKNLTAENLSLDFHNLVWTFKMM